MRCAPTGLARSFRNNNRPTEFYSQIIQKISNVYSSQNVILKASKEEVKKMFVFVLAVIGWLFCGVMALHDYNVNGIVRIYAVLFAFGTSSLPFIGMMCGKIF
jgi:hypothetical protein